MFGNRKKSLLSGRKMRRTYDRRGQPERDTSFLSGFRIKLRKGQLIGKGEGRTKFFDQSYVKSESGPFLGIFQEAGKC